MPNILRALAFLCALSLPPAMLRGQTATGALEINARITPTAGRPEPVRQFTFFVLTRGYSDIVREVEAQDALPSRAEFINGLKVSSALKAWMKEHDAIDLAAPDIDKLIRPEDVMQVPEFFSAYQRYNSGGVTAGLPAPKYREADKEANPAKYEKQKQEYFAAMSKFIQTHPATISGMELELAAVNPRMAWERLHADRQKRVAQLAPDTAQTKYLAAKVDTDLDGRALVSGLAPGNYWVSSIGMDAVSGDRRLVWDVPVTVLAGQTARVDLTNLNGKNPNLPALP
ncbi:MAG TPA: carboxypeptidase-like regulatory domain-containing protein [Candidatus Acidoferrum sp.]